MGCVTSSKTSSSDINEINNRISDNIKIKTRRDIYTECIQSFCTQIEKMKKHRQHVQSKACASSMFADYYDQVDINGVKTNYSIQKQKEGFWLTVADQKVALFSMHCDSPSEFVCLMKDKGDTLEYGNGAIFITTHYNISHASSFVWRCGYCRVGYSTSLCSVRRKEATQ